MNNPKFHLEEMPRRIVPVDPELGFKLDNHNRTLAAEVLKNKKAVLVETTQLGNQLYKYGNRFILVDPYSVKTLYYMKWEDTYYSILNTMVVKEVLHWRDRGVFESRNLTSHVFFDLLLPIHRVIMTDIRHTESGEKFWLRAIDEAFDRNLYVYYVNFLQSDASTKNVVRLLKDKLDFNSLLISQDSLNLPWGDEHKFEARRILISSKILNSEVTQ